MRRPATLLVVALATFAVAAPARSEELSRFDRERARMMLDIIKKDLLDYYYDDTFGGLQLDAAFQTANERIDQAKSISQLFAGISRPLIQLNDSHTFFRPPERSARISFGWEKQMIGDGCFITAVQDDSDAKAKGLKRGDQVLEIDGRKPTRDNLWGMDYVHRVLAPRPSLPILVQSPGGTARKVEVAAKIEQRKRVTHLTDSTELGEFMRERDDEAYLRRHRYKEMGDSLLIWKMPQFDMTADEVRTKFMSQVRKRPALILDLRGDPGGSVETLQAMVGAFIGDKTKIGDLKGRKPQLPMMARKAGDLYEGKLVVLVDSGSASASELFARTVQLAGRGKVIGDKTSGSVMESRTYDHMIGENNGIIFSTSITIADIIMTDGHGLEHVGVTPDEVLLPTAEDLAAGRDPVLAHAASLCGVALTAENAGDFFPDRVEAMTGDDSSVALRESEVEIGAIRAQGKGGQNVNKVSNAVHLRFDIRASSLPDELKARLLGVKDRRISDDGVVVIKAQTHRSLEKNREDALARLRALIAAASDVPRPRRPTKATRGSKERRVSRKIRRGRVKALRGRVDE